MSAFIFDQVCLTPGVSCLKWWPVSVQVTCGGCHMVVLARPRVRSEGGGVTLEAGDVTEDFLEKPYVELLGDTADSSALQRSLSARVRRRERVGGIHPGLPSLTVCLCVTRSALIHQFSSFFHSLNLGVCRFTALTCFTWK